MGAGGAQHRWRRDVYRSSWVLQSHELAAHSERLGVTMPTIPTNFWLSFTGGTGGSKNIHEIDDLQVCANKMVAASPVIDHFRFENPGTMDTCQPSTITVTACTAPEPACTPFTGAMSTRL